MAGTYEKLTPKDKARITKAYELFLTIDDIADWFQTAAEREGWFALVYLLDSNGNRVTSEGKAMTSCHRLTGKTKEEALAALDTRFYEFKQWL